MGLIQSKIQHPRVPVPGALQVAHARLGSLESLRCNSLWLILRSVWG